MPAAPTWTPPARYRGLVDFIETHLWIEPEQGGLIPFRLNGLQRRYLEIKDRWLQNGGRPRFLILKSRRTGVSTFVQAENYYEVADLSNRHVVTIANTGENTDRIFNIPKTFWRNAMAGSVAKGESKSNKREFTFHGGASDYYVGTAGAGGFGRGATLQRAHLSEVGYFPGDYISQARFLSGVENAARRGEVVCETTANGASGLFYEKWVGAIKGENDWCPIFIPWWWDDRNVVELTDEKAREIIDTLTDEERILIKRVWDEDSIYLGPEHIAWRRMMKRQEGRLFDQEYPESWETAFLHSGDPYFSRHRVIELLALCGEPISERQIPGGTETVWRNPAEGMDYFIGADCAEGLPDGDYSNVCVLDRNGEQVARWTGHWRAYEHAALIDQVAQDYGSGGRRAWTAVEINNHGHAVMNSLIRERHFPESDLYHHVPIEDPKSQPVRKQGWLTGPATRPVMLQKLAEALEWDGIGRMVVHDRAFLQECLTFVRNKKGGFEAAAGAHDDLVFGWGIAWQALQAPRPLVGALF